MKKSRLILLICICSVLTLLISSYCVLRFGFGNDILDRSGWQKKNGQTRYLSYMGIPQKQWQVIEEKTYYFDPDTGYMHTGWLTLEGSTYYIGSDGLCTGLQQIDGSTYFFDRNGIMQTGWITTDNSRHHFDTTGKGSNGWLKQEHNSYYLIDGCMQTGWLTQDEGVYYLTVDGTPATLWQEIGQNKYYFGSDRLMRTGWQEIDGKRYFFAEDGAMHMGWLEWEGERYYFREDGTMAIGQVQIDSDNHYFTSTGKYILLVNQWNPMPSGYEPELVDMMGYLVDPICKDALEQMILDCRAAGKKCTVNNTYRSTQTQQYMWDTRIAQRLAQGMSYEEAIEVIGQSLALVGSSEHHLGLAADLNGDYDWLAENCWDYGFILRYPSGTKEITGIIYEPWHFRYVGLELSKELQELGLCLEEYMQMLTEQQ